MYKIPNRKITNRTVSLSYFHKFSLFKFMQAIFITGLVYGAAVALFNRDESVNHLDYLLKVFVYKRCEQNIFITFFASFFDSAFLITILFVCGMLPIGQPISLFSPFFYGLGLGMSSLHMYFFKGMYGIVFFTMLILPTKLISTLIIILASKESLRLSNKVFRNLYPEKSYCHIFVELKKYMLKFFVLYCFQIFAALVDVILTFFFVKFVS